MHAGPRRPSTRGAPNNETKSLFGAPESILGWAERAKAQPAGAGARLGATPRPGERRAARAAAGEGPKPSAVPRRGVPLIHRDRL